MGSFFPQATIRHSKGSVFLGIINSQKEEAVLDRGTTNLKHDGVTPWLQLHRHKAWRADPIGLAGFVKELSIHPNPARTLRPHMEIHRALIRRSNITQAVVTAV